MALKCRRFLPTFQIWKEKISLLACNLSRDSPILGLKKMGCFQCIVTETNLHYSSIAKHSQGIIMTILTVAALGQVTFRDDVLKHLGNAPGDNIELDLLPGGRWAAPDGRNGTIAGFVGLLAGKSNKVATIEEISKAASQPTHG